MLFALTWPIFVELLLNFAVGVVDSFMLSRISDSAAAAVSATNSIMAAAMVVLTAFAQSTGILVGRCIGSGNQLGIGSVHTIGVLVNAAFGLLFSLLFLLFKSQLLSLLGLQPELNSYGSIYMTLAGGASIFVAISLAHSSIIKAHGKTALTMVSALAANLVNVSICGVVVLGDYDLTRKFFDHFFPTLNSIERGVAGVGFAALCARLCSMFLLMAFARVHMRLDFKLERSLVSLNRSMKRMMSIAVPAAVEPVLYQASQLVLTMIVSNIGSQALAVRAYAANISTVPVLFSVALSQASQILVSRCFGAKDYVGASKVLHRSLLSALLISSGIVLLNAMLGSELFGLFTHDATILALGTQVLWWNFLLEPGRTSNVIVGSSLRAVGDPKYPALLGIVFMWCVAIPVAWFLGIKLSLGIVGVWIGIAADEGFRGIFMYLRWRKMKWANGIAKTEL